MANYTENYNLVKPTMAETADIRTLNGNMDTVDTIMHDTQVSMADAFDSTASYAIRDLVMYEFKLYQCIHPHEGPWDADNWVRVNAAETGGNYVEITPTYNSGLKIAETNIDGDQDEIKVPYMAGATAQADGAGGVVPAPTSQDVGKYLDASGGWSTPSGGGGGTTVVPNPVGEPTDELDTVRIGDTIFSIPGSGGGSGSGFEQTLLYDSGSATSGAPFNQNVNLLDSLSNYDLIMVEWNTTEDRTRESPLETSDIVICSVQELMSNNFCLHFSGYDTRWGEIVFTDTTFNFFGRGGDLTPQLYKIWGIKFGGGNGSGYSETDLFVNTGSSNPETITLSDSIQNYDEIAFIVTRNAYGNTYKLQYRYITDELSIGDKIQCWCWGPNNEYFSYVLTDYDEFSNMAEGNALLCNKIVGINHSSGGTDVEANPEEPATEELHSLKVGDTVYELPVIDGKASGAVASFSDGSANPIKSIDIGIVPLQSGSGDPSPDNNRPISGWTGANVTRCGKNLFNKDTVIDNKYWDSNGEQSAVGYAHSDYIKVKPSTTYYSNADTTGYIYYPVFFDANKNNKGVATGKTTGAFTTDSDTAYVIINTVKTLKPINEIYLIEGSTPIEYEPYNGTTYTIPFEDSQGDPLNIYGGEIHIRRVNGVWSGEVVETEVSQIYDGTENITAVPSYHYLTVPVSNNHLLQDAGIGITSLFKFASSGTNRFAVGNVNSLYWFWPAQDSGWYDDASAFKTFLATQYANGEPLQIVYPLATPNTYPIDPANIPNIVTLLGDNNMFADTGDIDEVIYIRDLNLAFNELWDLVHSNSGTRSLSLSKGAIEEEGEKEEEKKEEPTEEEPKEETKR